MRFFFTLFITFFFVFIRAAAQEEREAGINADVSTIDVSTNKIYGKLVDQLTGKPIEAASVQLFILSGRKKDSLISGMLSRSNGDFNFSDLPDRNDFLLKISAIGYKEWEQQIVIHENREENAGRGGRGREKFSRDIGNIQLESNVKQLDAVTVVASKPALEMGIDRKIFNVEKSITSTGGTAIDVMKNIPSVSVDIDGNVELRNSSPQLFVDGRPTILTLDQIPADNIEKVELITNPSAKFDASSSGGIINIVLKKNKRVGLNGLASVSGGAPELYAGNLNLNLRQGKINFYTSGSYNQSGGRAKGKADRQNKSAGTITDYFNQETITERSRKFTSVRLGLDYFIDNRNTLGVTQSFSQGRFSSDENQDQRYLDQQKVLRYYGNRTSAGQYRFGRKSTRLNYKHNFPEEGKELTADINYNYGPHTNASDIINAFFNPDGTEYSPSTYVINDGNSNTDEVTFQVDFVDPVKENAKIEAGIRSYYNNFRSYFNAFADNNGQLVKLPLSNNYRYRDMINAMYITFSNKLERFAYQVGLRTEYSKFDGLLIDSSFKFGYEYPNRIEKIWDALFPSVFLTRQLGEKDEMQLNYTRRIRRPRFWQLNPFIEINDPANLRQGNPSLRPEFINSFEFNYSHDYASGNFLGVLYFRNNPADITQYSDTITAAQYQQLNNAAVNPDAIVNTYINAAVTNRYGAEFTLQHKLGKNFDITPTINLQYRSVRANVSGVDLNNEGFNWEAKLITNYKIVTDNEKSIFNNLSLQLTGEYESPEVIPQGKRLSQYSSDFALKKEFLKNNKAAFTFSVNDIFNTDRWGAIYDTERFYQDSYRRWRVRTLRVTFSYKFGDADFSLLRRGGGRDGGDDD